MEHLSADSGNRFEESDDREIFSSSTDAFGAELSARRDTTAGERSAADTRRIHEVRQELKDATHLAERKSFKPMDEKEPFVPAVDRLRSRKPTGKLRRWMMLGLAALGVLRGGADIEAADAKAKKSTLPAGSVPVFKTPMQSGESTNVYTYKHEVWKPTTPEEKERAAKAKERLAEEKKKPGFTVTATSEFEKGSGTAEQAKNSNVKTQENTPASSAPKYSVDSPSYSVDNPNPSYRQPQQSSQSTFGLRPGAERPRERFIPFGPGAERDNSR